MEKGLGAAASLKSAAYGGIAQLVERLLCTQDVRSSTLLTSISTSIVCDCFIRWVSDTLVIQSS